MQKKNRLSDSSDNKENAGKIASEITEDGQEHMFVVLGGDGTLNEVLSGIKSLEKVTLGYIPIGSSNDFARGTGIPGDPFKALDTILSPKRVEKMDIGVLKRERKKICSECRYWI